MLNNIILMGRLTADPELRTTATGAVPVCAFTVACERDYKSPDGEKITDFISVVAWRGLAETVSRYFSKGRMIVVQGTLNARKWQDKEGNNRVSWEVIADHVWFGDSKNSGHPDADKPFPDEAPPERKAKKQETEETSADGDFTPLDEDDLPF